MRKQNVKIYARILRRTVYSIVYMTFKMLNTAILTFLQLYLLLLHSYRLVARSGHVQVNIPLNVLLSLFPSDAAITYSPTLTRTPSQIRADSGSHFMTCDPRDPSVSWPVTRMTRDLWPKTQECVTMTSFIAQNMQ